MIGRLALQVSQFVLCEQVISHMDKGKYMINLMSKTAVLAFLCVSLHVSAAEPQPTIDAQFETTKCAKPCKQEVKTKWWMMRTPKTIELRQVDNKTNTLSKRGEMWKYNPNGQSSYLFLMHDDQRAIEYLFDDLKILGIGVDERQWQINSQFITNAELAGFKKIAKTSKAYQGYATEVYTGKIGKADVHVTWLPALKLPVKLEYVYPKSNITIALKTLVAGDHLQKSPAPKTTVAKLGKYDHVYYTDIGDMEEDPTAQAWIANAAGAPGMHDHHH
jgi:hypothetical protein